ncbi:MAG: hypothetical protein LAT68_08555 [Cyclobacteriaceae bacterium]|nr:hypothetical protein [Cyclobacteriaceae bacterium]MCH8516367.1 hypothetical protein [Cyclobacteriaceae bacterium]
MNTSTEGVTLNAAFLNDVLNLYDGKPSEMRVLQNMCADHDLSKPDNKVPMKVYNEMCDWIEKEIGPINTKKLGRKIGNTAYGAMVQFGMIDPQPKPEEIMKALAQVASTMIQDPEGRGWEIVSSGNKEIIMRRTQTFNSTLQFGLLDELMRKTTASMPKVEFVKEVAKGDEFDEYKITWI